MSETTETTEKPIESNPVEGNEKGEGKTLPNLSKISTYWSMKELLAYFDISEFTVRSWIAKGAPKRIPGAGYPVEAFCRWLVSSPNNGETPGQDFRQKAEAVIKQICPPKATLKGKAKNKKKLEVGLIAALERARQAEVDAYTAHMNYMTENDAINTNALDAWQKTLEILRRCENDFTKVLEMRKELVSLKKVQDWMHPLIEQTKMQLLNIPSKLAPQLENLPWHEIQKKIDEEIRSAISKLKAPDKDMD